ncbi:MAG: deoxyguanosinetriphosphate triphosphohydrolase [candidate division Zixibacteria bacterium]|nr:deoxyguanosinetriphosphate triphosphohydrolase [candidate division Zixibacteria bacterium]
MTENLTRADIEARELKSLAPYAAISSRSRGRVYPAREHPLRTAFQRDRDRIIHSAAFRRMEYKTQVFIPHEKDHYRTRLTHTIEVAQISRTLARNLRLNEDLAEAIALVHDVGHTPFGHSGEYVLDKLLKERGGFNHNRQTLRVVDFLEQRYDEHPGLNLSYEVREGIAKHETTVDLRLSEFNPDEKPTLEASLVDIADEITYNAHDIDDGLSSGIIATNDLKGIDLFRREPFAAVIKRSSPADDKGRYALVRRMLDFMVTDVLDETRRRLQQDEITDLNAVRSASRKIGAYSDETGALVSGLKEFLNRCLYKHERLRTMSEWAEEILQTIFSGLLEKPSVMPPRFQEMLLTEEKEIVIADYIAGMTDRYAVKMYDQFQ